MRPRFLLLLLHLIVTIIITVCLTISTEAAPTYIHNRCSTTGNFTPNSSYHSSLNLLLSSLSSNATSHFFYNLSAAAAAAADPPAVAYGLFLCRGDVTDHAVCGDCVAAAAGEVVKRCPAQFEAIIWYEECMLRYANRSFFGTADDQPNDYYYFDGSNNVEDTARFNSLVAETVRAAAEEAVAAAGSGEKKFATREANFTGFRTLYSLVECTPDLSGGDCQRCLDTAIAELPKCCSGEDRIMYLYPSCYLRYDRSRFYNQIVNGTSQPPAKTPSGKSTISTRTILAIVIPSVASLALLLIFGYYCFARGRKKHSSLQRENGFVAADIINPESLQCDWATIEAATNRFSLNNKLGQGGFGEVYKGVLPNGQEVAVKRLILRSSGDGSVEFKNEIVLLAKLQHRNLVRLLGFCLEREEKLLVYEFVPNKSLDYFLYDPIKKGQLNWSTRHKIIGGIARGILYLHEDSRLRIIHRDLKPSNILLDANYEPKVSDFGIARLFGVDQTRADTSKIAGTLGYMSPEYALHGRFSLKSDVYSFGIIILEILSGKKNSTFFQPHNEAEDLLTYAWKLWKDGTAWKFLDESLLDCYSDVEVARCVHIGLLCVQEDPDDRPKITTIVLMLNTSSMPLPLPHQPVSYGRTKTNSNRHEMDLNFDLSSSRETPLSLSDY